MKYLKPIMKYLKPMGLILGLIMVFYAGTQMGATSSSTTASAPETQVAPDTVWTCSMHPHIKLGTPGQCPICGMDLIPLETGGSSGNDAQLVMNEWDKKLAQIVTAPVERKFVDMPVRMVGKLEYDETKVKTISSWVDGRVDRLFVDYTGISVNKGDHLVELYSPDLLTGQEELIEAKRRVDASSKEKSEFLRNSDLRSLENAREKLRLWGLSDSQVKAIETSKKSNDRIVVTSPQSGIVIHKALNEGDYVKTGAHIYTVADLDSLWVKLDAYESDLQWLHYGQDVAVETEAYAGETFHGVISFIDPAVDDATRTVKVRVNVDNAGQRLKPGMFVRATVHSKLAQGGKVMDPKLAGKWIGPMHPEIIRDKAGICPVCKMDLVKAETLGYVSADADGQAPLVVPVTAVLRTGHRAVVYVEVEDSVYEGREVILGARAGEYYLVRSGLQEGEVVVTNGNFHIDSALQIKAKPSMMNMDGEVTGNIHEGSHGKTKTPSKTPKATQNNYDKIHTVFTPIYTAYFNAQRALTQDDFAQAQTEAQGMLESLDTVDMGLFKGEDHTLWMKREKELRAASELMVASDEIESLRSAFSKVSEVLIILEKHFGHSGEAAYYEAHCPMAFDNEGGNWLQALDIVKNPFFGSSMLNCGSIENTFPGVEQ